MKYTRIGKEYSFMPFLLSQMLHVATEKRLSESEKFCGFMYGLILKLAHRKIDQMTNGPKGRVKVENIQDDVRYDISSWSKGMNLYDFFHHIVPFMFEAGIDICMFLFVSCLSCCPSPLPHPFTWFS